MISGMPSSILASGPAWWHTNAERKVFTKNMTQKDAPVVTAGAPRDSRFVSPDVFAAKDCCFFCFFELDDADFSENFC